MGYTGTKTGYQTHSLTSEDAAREVDKNGTARGQAALIADFLYSAGQIGYTADQLRTLLRQHGYPQIQSGTVAARLSMLEARSVAVKTTTTRKTSSGKNAYVYLRGIGTLDSPLVPARPSITTLRRDLENILAILERNPAGVTLMHNGPFHNKLRTVLGVANG